MPNSRVYFQVWIHCHDPICQNMSSQTKEFHDSSMQESKHAFWIRIQTAGFGPTPVDFAVQTAPGAIPIMHIQTIVSFHSSFSFLYIFFFCCCLGSAVLCRTGNETVTCLPYYCMHHLHGCAGHCLVINHPSSIFFFFSLSCFLDPPSIYPFIHISISLLFIPHILEQSSSHGSSSSSSEVRLQLHGTNSQNRQAAH